MNCKPPEHVREADCESPRWIALGDADDERAVRCYALRGSPAVNPKLVSYLAAGSIKGLRPLRYEKRIARNRFIFLTVFFFADPSGTLVGIVLGVGAVLLLVMALLRGTYKLDVRRFFTYSSILLVVLAAGLAGYGTHELIEASESSGFSLGVLSQDAFNINPSSTDDIFHERGAIGSILRALVGYDGNPEWLRVIVYLGYWTVVGAYVFRTYRPVRLLRP